MSSSGYFRSLAELSGTSKSLAQADQEFPNYSPGEMLAGKGKTSRRSMMKFAGASMALAGLTMTGCRRWPKEEIVAYSSNRQTHIPGVAEWYASAFELGGIADGVLVRSYDGRPTKVEGSPDHPMTVAQAEGPARYGSSTMFAQASVLEMYDPERSRGVRTGKLSANRSESSFEEFLTAAKSAIAGGGVAFLTTATSSQTFASLKGKFPGAKWYEYEALSDDNCRAGAKMAFGSVVRPILDLTKADVVVSVDSDFLGQHPAHLRYAADWATKRRTVDAEKAMSRVYVVESAFTSTGAAADVRHGTKLSRIDGIARAIAAGLGVAGASGEAAGAESAFVSQVVADVKKAGANAVFIAGEHLAPETQAVVHAINSAIKSAAVKYVTLPDQDRASHVESIKTLAADLNSGAVKALFVLSANPAYDAPADLMFAEAISKAPFSAYLGIYENETSHLCNWHVPEAHYLESWGEARGYDGTVSLMQPLIEPMFGGKSKVELLAALAGVEGTGREWLKSTVKLSDEVAFQKALQVGVIANSGYPAATVTAAAIPAAPAAAAGGSGLEVRFVGSSLYDGRFANLGWLCELPDSMTRMTWDNCIILSKKDADAAGVETNDVVRLTVGSKTLDIAVYVLPGQPIGMAQVALGYARKAAGEIGNNNGFDTYSLRTTGGFFAAGGSIQKVPGDYELATTQEQYPIYSPQWKKTQWVAQYALDVRLGQPNESGTILHETTLARFKKDTSILGEEPEEIRKLSLQLFDPPNSLQDMHAWGMAIDMNACTGCGACVVACQAENNIPTVGKHQVLMHRAMHWIRIDRYFKHDKEADPDVENPTATFMPMMCVHCENAPCEQVCPVAATVHDTEGLNTMVYNRCIGTRYCSNNCPYKVRRFNYFDYHSTSPRGGLRAPWPNIPDLQQRERVDPVRAMGFNPDVTVRMRGVMEKCTYCTQRIQTTKIAQRNKMQRGEGGSGKVDDGMVLTACQQACPTQAIWFGDMNDRKSKVVSLQKSPRSYNVLSELDTRPRTKYLGRVRNLAVEPMSSGGRGEGPRVSNEMESHEGAGAATKAAEHEMKSGMKSGANEGGGH